MEQNKTQEQPKLQTTNEGAFKGIFLAPINHLQAITNYLAKVAETDEELAKIIAEGKKTFKGCDRFIKNNMKDLHRELNKQEIVFDDNSIHTIALWYMKNEDVADVQNAVEEVKKTTTPPKPKDKGKDKKQDEPKKNTKVIPLTPQMGSLFGDDDF